MVFQVHLFLIFSVVVYVTLKYTTSVILYQCIISTCRLIQLSININICPYARRTWMMMKPHFIFYAILLLSQGYGSRPGSTQSRYKTCCQRNRQSCRFYKGHQKTGINFWGSNGPNQWRRLICILVYTSFQLTNICSFYFLVFFKQEYLAKRPPFHLVGFYCSLSFWFSRALLHYLM